MGLNKAEREYLGLFHFICDCVLEFFFSTEKHIKEIEDFLSSSLEKENKK